MLLAAALQIRPRKAGGWLRHLSVLVHHSAPPWCCSVLLQLISWSRSVSKVGWVVGEQRAVADTIHVLGRPALAIPVPQLSLEPVQCQGRAGDLLGRAWCAAEPGCQPAPVLAAPPHSVICEGQGLRRHSALRLSNHRPGAWRYPSALLPRASRQGFILLPRVPHSGQGCWSPAS